MSEYTFGTHMAHNSKFPWPRIQEEKRFANKQHCFRQTLDPFFRNCQRKHDSIKSPDTKPRNTSQMSHKAELCTLQLQVLIFNVMRGPVNTRLPHGPMMAHDFCAASCPLDWMPIHGKARLQVHSERRSVNKRVLLGIKLSTASERRFSPNRY